ncbi:MAG: MBOAT family protein [Candidatus Aminicenantes bacterium]|nr:MAG: MBOAT family protein [Candidatus Aminicenantes bacterium]
MSFNSLGFLIFFPLVVSLYFAVSYRFRWIFLLGASYYFYMCWKVEYVLLIIVSTLIIYWTGIQIAKHQIRSKKRMFLILALVSNLGILFLFKYFSFFNDSLRSVINLMNIFYNVPSFNVLLPVGISFYTFQALSYSIDVYRGKREPERHLGVFALYVAFFPQLVSGPIERSTRLLPQFYKKHDFDYQRVTDGLKLMTWGFFKKIVIADRLAILVNQVYNHPTDYHGTLLLIATYFFAFQIYCDFSGYTDIAIGAAEVMGFELMDNFKRPYFSKSISEFWRRWHISLSSWFRDYVYIPLGGNRVKKWRWYYNLIVVFLITGLWHGARWTFVIWGGLHGFYYIFSMWTKQSRGKLSKLFHLNRLPSIDKILKVFITFHLVLLGWIFFRANSLSDAIHIIWSIFKEVGYIITHLAELGPVEDIIFGGKALDFGMYEIIFSLLLILFMESVHLFQRKRRVRLWLSEKPVWFRWSVYCVIVLVILYFGIFGEKEFIYFQF